MTFSLSFEFFPPKSEQAEANLLETATKLGALNPSFYSVTFGAGGSTRERTVETVLEIHKTTGICTAPHLSCIASTRESIKELLLSYQAKGIRRIVALRGDLPSGIMSAGELRYANELVEFIRQETGDHFHIEVAAYPEIHPQAANANADLLNFKRKVEAGANSAITQYFYSADAYFRFVEDSQKQRITIPIVPGIMPITNFIQLARFSDTCGAEIPRWVRKRLESFGDDKDSIRAFGIEVVTGLCERLIEVGVPGLHFYTLNQAETCLTILGNLDLPST